MIGTLTSKEETAVKTFLSHLQQLGDVVQQTTLFGSKAHGDSHNSDPTI